VPDQPDSPGMQVWAWLDSLWRLGTFAPLVPRIPSATTRSHLPSREVTAR
jgi:hypothetical protein